MLNSATEKKNLRSIIPLLLKTADKWVGTVPHTILYKNTEALRAAAKSLLAIITRSHSSHSQTQRECQIARTRNKIWHVSAKHIVHVACCVIACVQLYIQSTVMSCVIVHALGYSIDLVLDDR